MLMMVVGHVTVLAEAQPASSRAGAPDLRGQSATMPGGGALVSETLTAMIAAHGVWKYRLHEAIISGNSGFSADDVASDDRCALGRWVHGDEGRRLHGQDQYEQVRAQHARFHRLAADILRGAVGGQPERARQDMESGTEFMTISASLVTLLDNWRNAGRSTPSAPHGRGGGQAASGAVGGVRSEATTAAAARDDTFLAELVGTSVETSAQADIARREAGDVTAAMDSLAGAVEELSATINEISTSAAVALTTTTEVVGEADSFTEGVAALTRSVGQIESVLSLITGIAKQTSLLALNASIEAARAGEVGRGFAVVASEVKELAHQTSVAAAQVTSQIRQIQAQATQTAATMDRFTSGIQAMQDNQATIAAAVEEQTAATAEINRKLTETAMASRDIAEYTAAVALAARTTADSARHLAAR